MRLVSGAVGAQGAHSDLGVNNDASPAFTRTIPDLNDFRTD